jgi:hypothetical protein
VLKLKVVSHSSTQQSGQVFFYVSFGLFKVPDDQVSLSRFDPLSTVMEIDWAIERVVDQTLFSVVNAQVSRSIQQPG